MWYLAWQRSGPFSSQALRGSAPPAVKVEFTSPAGFLAVGSHPAKTLGARLPRTANPQARDFERALHEEEQLADLVAVRHEVDDAGVEGGVLGVQGAEQRLEGRARVAGGVLVDVDQAGVGGQREGHLGRGPESGGACERSESGRDI